jgi:integrase
VETVVEDRAADTWQQGEDQEHYERPVQSRYTVGMGRTKIQSRKFDQSAKRSKIPTVLSVEEIQRLFSFIKEPCRTAVILDAVSGLRVGELLELKWEDVRFDQLELNVARSVSRQVVTSCKTEVSRKPIPMNPEIADMLWKWKLEAPYNQPGDWIFASPHRERESNPIGLDRSSERT